MLASTRGQTADLRADARIRPYNLRKTETYGETMQVKIIGAGLAGCEAALWLADRGVQVELYEQKPAKYSPAHKSAGFAELICSNSLKAERPDSASGLLKIEMKMMAAICWTPPRPPRGGGRCAGRGPRHLQRRSHPDGGGGAEHHRSPGAGGAHRREHPHPRGHRPPDGRCAGGRDRPPDRR
mgnify:CR=1 FL=1